MKSKKIKKMAKLIHEEFRKYDKELRPIKEDISLRGDWSEYDSEVSEKFKKMILNLANYKNNISIGIDDDRISISTSDITKVKVPVKKNLNTLYSDDDYVEMSLIKNLGFTINYGYKLRSNYKDENLFDEIKPILVQKLREINADNFNEIWTSLMRESGILRDNNLDEIFNG